MSMSYISPLLIYCVVLNSTVYTIISYIKIPVKKGNTGIVDNSGIIIGIAGIVGDTSIDL